MSVSDVVGDPGRIFEERPGISRRQLIKAGAWAAPVIVLATAAPAAAATSPTTPATPPGFAQNSGAGTMGPEMISGASRTQTTERWGSASAPAANMYVYGPFVPGGLVQMMYTVPSSSAELNGSNPAAWKWGIEGNGEQPTATWHAGTAPGSGYWLISFIAPSWANTSTNLYVGLRMTVV